MQNKFLIGLGEFIAILCLGAGIGISVTLLVITSMRWL